MGLSAPPVPAERAGPGTGVAVGALVVMSLAWASVFPFIEIAERSIPAVTSMLLRAVFAAFLMLGIAVVTGRSLRLPARHHGLMLVLAQLTVTAAWLGISIGEEYAPSGVVALATSSIPIFTFLISAFVLRKERATPSRLFGLALALVGLVLVIGPSRLEGGSQIPLGVAIVAAGLLAYAVGGMVAAARIPKDLHPVVTTTWSMVYACLALLAVALIFESPFAHAPLPAAWWSMAAAGTIGTAIPFLLYYWLVQQSGAVFASLFGYLVPVFGILLGVLWMGEPAGLGLAVGVPLILGGLYLVRKAPAPLTRG